MAGMTAKEGGEGAQSRFASALLNLGATYVHFGESKVCVPLEAHSTAQQSC